MKLVLALLLLFTAIGIIIYWIEFYRRGSVHVIKDEWYIKFERAFPPADLWMAGCAIVGAIGLLNEETYGLVFGLLTASSLIFLACTDITFNIQNNLYRQKAQSKQMQFEILINVWSLGFGAALIVLLGPMIAFA